MFKCSGMLRAGEFDDATALGDREFELLRALSRDQEYGADYPGDIVDRLVVAGLVQKSPFRGYELTPRGQLVAARGRNNQNQRQRFLSGFSKLSWPKSR